MSAKPANLRKLPQPQPQQPKPMTLRDARNIVLQAIQDAAYAGAFARYTPQSQATLQNAVAMLASANVDQQPEPQPEAKSKAKAKPRPKPMPEIKE